MIIKESIKQETSEILQEDNFSIPLKSALHRKLKDLGVKDLN